MAERYVYECDLCGASLGGRKPGQVSGPQFRVQFDQVYVDCCEKCASTKTVKQVAVGLDKWPFGVKREPVTGPGWVVDLTPLGQEPKRGDDK